MPCPAQSSADITLSLEAHCRAGSTHCPWLLPSLTSRQQQLAHAREEAYGINTLGVSTPAVDPALGQEAVVTLLLFVTRRLQPGATLRCRGAETTLRLSVWLSQTIQGCLLGWCTCCHNSDRPERCYGGGCAAAQASTMCTPDCASLSQYVTVVSPGSPSLLCHGRSWWGHVPQHLQLLLPPCLPASWLCIPSAPQSTQQPAADNDEPTWPQNRHEYSCCMAVDPHADVMTQEPGGLVGWLLCLMNRECMQKLVNNVMSSC